MRLVSTALLAAILSVCGCGARVPDVVDPAEVRATFASTDRDAIQGLIARLAAHGPRYEALLVENLADADRGVREWSAHAIGDLGLSGEATIDALVRSVEDEDDWVRWKAVRALGLLGPKAKRALPLLEPVAQAEQEVEVVRAAAQVAVRRIRGP